MSIQRSRNQSTFPRAPFPELPARLSSFWRQPEPHCTRCISNAYLTGHGVWIWAKLWSGIFHSTFLHLISSTSLPHFPLRKARSAQARNIAALGIYQTQTPLTRHSQTRWIPSLHSMASLPRMAPARRVREVRRVACPLWPPMVKVPVTTATTSRAVTLPVRLFGERSPA